MSRWHEIDWSLRERQEAMHDHCLERSRKIAESFIFLSDLTPVKPIDQLKRSNTSEEDDSLDGERATIRGRADARKFRQTLWDGVEENERLKRMGVTTIGIQTYPGEFAGAGLHGEIHEGIAVAVGTMNIETIQDGQAVKHREVGPITYEEMLDSETKLAFGISRYYGEELSVLKIALGDGRIFYREFVELRNGEHRTAKALGQKDPVVTVIYKQPKQASLDPNPMRGECVW